MASYVLITLDTLAPQGLTLTINNGDDYTSSPTVSLAIGTSDVDKTGYQMKLWGMAGVANEAAATWESYAATKSVTLPTGDGLKTITIKLRDDVYNETAAVSDTITLDTAVPAINITGPDVARISKITSKSVSAFSFTCSVDYVEYKVKAVPTTNALESAGTLVATVNGSENTSGIGTFVGATAINVKINGTDLETASGGDAQKVVKVFVKTLAGTWSV